MIKPLQWIDFHIFVKIITYMAKKNAFIAGQEMWSTMVLEAVGKGINARIATGVSQVVSIGISPK